jgi:hypothetical protein
MAVMADVGGRIEGEPSEGGICELLLDRNVLNHSTADGGVHGPAVLLAFCCLSPRSACASCRVEVEVAADMLLHVAQSLLMARQNNAPGRQRRDEARASLVCDGVGQRHVTLFTIRDFQPRALCRLNSLRTTANSWP